MTRQEKNSEKPCNGKRVGSITKKAKNLTELNMEKEKNEIHCISNSKVDNFWYKFKSYIRNDKIYCFLKTTLNVLKAFKH